MLLIADITQRVRAERLRDLEHAVTRVLAEARGSSGAVEAVLKAVCEATGSVYGGRWVSDPDGGRLRCVESYAEDDARLREFIAGTLDARRAPESGGGLLRRVRATRKAFWIEDVAQAADFIRADAARAAGLVSAFAFPIMTGGEFYGAMEFFAREPLKRDDALLAIMDGIASQVGQFLARKEAESHMRFFANHDALTGLPNRTMFNQRLTQAVAQAGRHGKRVAVLFVDLDRFKVVNDTLGHEAGDSLLCDLATRLRESLRAGDTLGRQGGDEFVILLEDVADPKYVADVSQKILDTVSRPLSLKGQEYAVTASIGVSIYPDDGRDAQELLKNADIAMYRAKELGRNGFRFYSAALNAHSIERFALEAKLRRALEREEFLLYYQPKVELASGKVVGVEALIRWCPAEGGMVPPADFIPLVEETGLIGPIGEWVLRAACADARRWQAAGHPPLRMAVNLSARQFMRESLITEIAEALGGSGLPASLLELEITESIVMQDPERAARVLADVHGLGVHVAIDDFGTGYSSLGYLKRFPVDTVKIDRSFIAGLPGDDDDVVITRTVIAMAHSMGLRVTAEGVETPEQIAFLREQRCDEVQGFLLGEPVPAGEMEALLGRAAALPAAS
jgi:diguanylate cyclase (GGDEF)-like protein